MLEPHYIIWLCSDCLTGNNNPAQVCIIPLHVEQLSIPILSCGYSLLSRRLFFLLQDGEVELRFKNR